MEVIVSLVFLIFPSCFESITLFIMTSLPLHHSFILGWFPHFENCHSVLCYPTKIAKILFPHLQKNNIKHNLSETGKVNIPNLLGG